MPNDSEEKEKFVPHTSDEYVVSLLRKSEKKNKELVMRCEVLEQQLALKPSIPDEPKVTQTRYQFWSFSVPSEYEIRNKDHVGLTESAKIKEILDDPAKFSAFSLSQYKDYGDARRMISIDINNYQIEINYFGFIFAVVIYKYASGNISSSIYQIDEKERFTDKSACEKAATERLRKNLQEAYDCLKDQEDAAAKKAAEEATDASGGK